MKNRIQAGLAEEYSGLTDEQRRGHIARELAEADDPVARKWRALAAAKRAIRLASTGNE